MAQILLLNSTDGEEWMHAVLYPDEWTPEHADKEAIEAMTAVQREVGDEWQWADYEPELAKRGFTNAPWHHGPCWDEDRSDDTTDLDSEGRDSDGNRREYL